MFSLTKYYMDCVTDSGEVVLCYASDLRVGGVHLLQSSILVHGEKSYSRQSFLRGKLPEKEEGGWVWNCPTLGVKGKWQSDAPAASPVKLYETKEGKSVVWQCLALKADVCISLKGEAEKKGVGYVECLNMDLEPWKLPLESLYWGRLHGATVEALAWIVWEGSEPLALLLKGNKVSYISSPVKARHDGTALELEGMSFEFSCRDVLRSGDISGTALRYLPRMVRHLLPDSILHLKETKWAGPARVLNSSGELSGFVIHEVVHFKP